MADNSTQTGADTIATDDVTTLNGSASSGIKVQRVKVGFGDDATHRDASANFPLPTVQTGALPSGLNEIGRIGELRSGSTTVSATGTSGAAVTLTIAAPGGGFTTYITDISITLYSAAARTGAATPWVVTTTNMGGQAWTFSTAGAIGANETQTYDPATPTKTAAAATATTIVCPAATGGIWRVNASYFSGV